MKINLSWRIFFAIWICFIIGCAQKPVQTQSKSYFPLTVIHVNDTHSHLDPISLKIKLDGKKYYVKSGGYARIYSYVEKIRKERKNVLFLHAGDMVQGTIYFTLCHGKADIDVLNSLSLDADVLGNHEFDKGPKFLLHNILFKAKFPILSANVKSNLFKNIVYPFIIKKFKKEKVAIVGLTTPSTKVISSPGPDVKFENTLKIARNVVSYLKSSGINKIIFLTHLGFKRDFELAKKVEDIDVIVGGHSHTLLGQWDILGKHDLPPYPVLIYNDKKPVLIATSWEWGKVVGDLDLVFDSKGVLLPASWKNSKCIMLIDSEIKFKTKSGEKVFVKGTDYKMLIQKLAKSNVIVMPEDQKVKAIINKYSKIVEKQRQRVVATITQNLWHVRLPGDTVEGQKLKQGSLLAPLVAKAFLLKARQNGGADLALENAGAVRKSLKKGKVSLADIYEVLPFGNTLCVLQITGKKLKIALENAVRRSLLEKKNTGSFPYLAGARLIWSNNKELMGIEVFENGAWESLKEDKVYRVVTNSYLAGGGDFYKEFKGAVKEDLGFLCADVFLEFLRGSNF